MTSKRTPEEILAAIEESDLDEELDRVMAMTPEQRRAELEGAGFDVEELHAEADAWHERMSHGAGAPDPGTPAVAVAAVAQARVRRAAERDRRRRPAPVVLWLAAAATAAVAGGALYAALHRTPGPTIVPLPPSPPSIPAPTATAVPDLVAAAELRHQAAAACDAQQWSACLAHLEEARAVDPDGDDAPSVKALWDRATRELERKH
jgi:hypothetical protein